MRRAATVSAEEQQYVAWLEAKAHNSGGNSPPMISLVIPIYNEQELVDTLHHTIVKTMETMGHTWEVVYVNDGSKDRSLELLLAHQAVDPHVTVVELSRNWGHQPALTAGLSVARGAAVVLIDGDLQDPPEVVAELIAAWQKGAQVVIAERRKRAERGLRKLLFPLLQSVKLFVRFPDTA